MTDESAEKTFGNHRIRSTDGYMDFLKSYKWLLVWSALFLLVAAVVKFIPLSKPLTRWVGGIELLLAIATGIAFGIKALQTED